MARQSYSVAVYHAELAYGGPEEGGWWYNTGKLIKLIKVFNSEDRAYGFRNRMQRLIEKTLNKGRRELSSVLSNGRYYAEVHEGSPPMVYPETRPHYE